MSRVIILPRVIGVLAVAVLLGSAVLVLFVHAQARPACTGTHSASALVAPPKTGLSSAGANVSATTLPPSRDNDAGRSRLADITPDADSDPVRRANGCGVP